MISVAPGRNNDQEQRHKPHYITNNLRITCVCSHRCILLLEFENHLSFGLLSREPASYLLQPRNRLNSCYLMPYGATVAASRVTCVCANALPCKVAPVCNIICLALRMVPLKLDVVPRVAPVRPPTCQTIFLACAPPARVTMAPLATVRSPAIWKIH